MDRLNACFLCFDMRATVSKEALDDSSGGLGGGS